MKLIQKIFNLDNHRSEAMKLKASSMGMQFSEEDDIRIKNQLSSFELFSKGRTKKVENILSSSAGLHLEYIFDFHYVVQAGNTAVRHKQTVFFNNSKQLNLPQFHLRPEHFVDKMLSLFGIKDINFDSNPEFSDKYKLTGEYESLVRKYFNKSVLDLLSTHHDFSLEGMNYYFILYKHKQLISPQELKSFQHLGQLLHELFLLQSNSVNEFLNGLTLED